MSKPRTGEEEMGRFQLPLQLQALCDGVPDREFLGSSARIPKGPTRTMAKLIAKAKRALASKPSFSRVPPLPPGLTKEEMDAMWARSVRKVWAQSKRRCKAQQRVTQQQSFMLNQVDQQHATQQQVTPQQHHPYFATTTSEITPDAQLANSTPIIEWSKFLESHDEAIPTKRHREDTQEERRGSNKRIKLTAMG